MIHRAVVVLLLFLSACHGWTKTDTALELAAQASIAADWVQTEHSVSIGMREHNPLIGSHGERLVVYFPAMMVVHAAIAWLLPSRARTAFQGLTVGIQATTLYRNNIEIDRQLSTRVK